MTRPYDPSWGNGENRPDDNTGGTGGQWQPQQPQGDPQWQPGWQQPQQPPSDPQWSQPPADPKWQPGWEQPGQPQWQPPQPPADQQWQPQQPWPAQPGEPQFGPPPGEGWGQPGQPPDQPPGKGGGRGKLIAATVAAVVVIGGGVATYAAVNSSDNASGGASSPQAAVQKMIGDLNNADLLGALNDLAPNERSAIVTPLTQAIDKLKKNDIVKPSTDLSHVQGVTFKLTNPTFTSKPLVINDHEQIVELTGGKLTVSANASNLPLTSDLLKALHGTANGKSQTFDIAQHVKEKGHPVRLATTKSGDSWYPSIFYTAADNATTAAGKKAPTPAQRIPNVGGSSPDDAVRTMITALITGNAKRAIELTSPDEMAVLHDYGALIVAQSHFGTSSSPVSDLQFTDQSITGGIRVSLKSLAFTVDGQPVKLSISGSCLTITAQGASQKRCAAQALSGLGASGLLGTMTTAQKQAINDLLSGITGIGLDVTQTDGKYYVNPVRSFFDLANELLGGLKGNDGQVLLHLAGH